MHESVVDEFVIKLAEKMSGLTVGPSVEASTPVGPLTESKARDSMEAFVEDAVARGAKVVVGGSRVEGPGYIFEPTLLRDVPADARAVTEEIFGPVALVVTFSTEYELASYVFTENISRGLRIGDRIEFGLMALNVGVISSAVAPFGGVKQSGLGREGGAECITEYATTQYIGIENPWGGVSSPGTATPPENTGAVGPGISVPRLLVYCRNRSGPWHTLTPAY